MPPSPRLFAVPRTDPLLLVIAPEPDGGVSLTVRRGWNPLTDEEPDHYEHLTADEALDVLHAVVSDEFAYRSW